MNIREAKQEIIYTLRAYHRKDNEGRYVYPLVRQRPILLMGPPGIGKTAIMGQIAQECGVGLVAYTMTHHTRQSAIGLPRITSKIYGGCEVSVTEYTLSEIIASVYEVMEKTGNREGILFLDEINCVSETLAPTMLQFLQNKMFGSHKLPEGWMIVAAGNPSTYNKSVREFDIVTLDRVRRIDVEANLEVWMEYAWEQQIHGAILSYLQIKDDRFYIVEQRGEEKSFVTARGWEDLSELLKNYEMLQIPVSPDLAGQFLQKADVARDFTAYYQLYQKNGIDYNLPAILDGTAQNEANTIAMAQNASFEERFTIVHLTLECLNKKLRKYIREDRRVSLLHKSLLQYRTSLENPQNGGNLDQYLENQRKSLKIKLETGLLKPEEAEGERWVLAKLEEYDVALKCAHLTNKNAQFERIKYQFQEEVGQRTQTVAELQVQFDRAFTFLTHCFGEGQEMVLFVSGLTRNDAAMAFICLHGCDNYLRRSDILLYRKRERELQAACQALEL